MFESLVLLMFSSEMGDVISGLLVAGNKSIAGFMRFAMLSSSAVSDNIDFVILCIGSLDSAIIKVVPSSAGSLYG